MPATIAGTHLGPDIHANRPAANAAGQPIGALYSCTTHGLIYKTDGSSWSTYATLGAAGSGSITASGYTQSTAKILGRSTASTGAIEEISVGTGLSLSAGSLTATGGAAGALVLLEEHTASASASLLFTTRNVSGQSGATIQSDYDAYLLVLLGLLPTTTNGQLQLDVSTDGGSTYDTTSGHYRNRNIAGGGALGLDGPGSTHIFLSYSSPNIVNTAAEGISGAVRYVVPQTGSAYPSFLGHLGYYDGGQDTTMFTNGHYLTGGAAINAFRLVMSTGNTASGTARWYGIAK